MPKKQLSVPSVPITADMYQHINRIRTCKTTGEEAGAMLDESIKALLLCALDEMAKQHKTSLQQNRR